ncbi:MAG: hypothetical protein IJ021_01925 [Clostridia bacterium]|nr:hypothetical protein [Clostridia bacterium]
MGAWSVSVTGNDTAQDLKSEYQAAFFYNDVETALEKIERYVRAEMCDESDEEEWCNYIYSLADFMWKKGILTDAVRDRAIAMIDSGFGLDIWADEGEKMLAKRKKALAEFKDKLLSPQPEKKKIKVDLYLNPIFETGDIIALQLQTKDKYYVSDECAVSEEEFRAMDGKYVAMRKVYDKVSYTSRIEPSVKDIWAVFQLYGKIFDEVPTMKELKHVKWARGKGYKKGEKSSYFVEPNTLDGAFICASSMVYFRRHKYRVIGNLADKDCTEKNTVHKMIIFMNKPWGNEDTDFINAILG